MKANLITIPKAYYHYGYVLIKLKFFNFFCMSIIWKKMYNLALCYKSICSKGYLTSVSLKWDVVLGCRVLSKTLVTFKLFIHVSSTDS